MLVALQLRLIERSTSRSQSEFRSRKCHSAVPSETSGGEVEEAKHVWAGARGGGGGQPSRTPQSVSQSVTAPPCSAASRGLSLTPFDDATDRQTMPRRLAFL